MLSEASDNIDEAFLDFRGFDPDKLDALGHTISRTVRHSNGLPVSIGIAPTKTLAKIASKLCKKYPKLNGCCLVHKAEDIEKVLKKFPVGDVWGIGPRYEKMLNAAGVNTAYDFTQMPPQWVRKKMSVVGLRTWKELRGEPCIEIVPVRSVGFRHAAYRRSFVYGDVRRKVTQTKERLRGTVRVHLYRLAQGAIAKFRTAHRKTRYADGQHVGIDRYGRRRSAADLQERFRLQKSRSDFRGYFAPNGHTGFPFRSDRPG